MRRKRRPLHLNGNSYVCNCALLSLQHTVHNWIIIEEQTNAECLECASWSWRMKHGIEWPTSVVPFVRTHFTSIWLGYCIWWPPEALPHTKIQTSIVFPAQFQLEVQIVCCLHSMSGSRWPLLLLLLLVRIGMQCAKKTGDWLCISIFPLVVRVSKEFTIFLEIRFN